MARRTRSLSRLPVLVAVLAMAVAAVVLASGQGSAQEPAPSPVPSPEGPSRFSEQVRTGVQVLGKDIARWFVLLKSGPAPDSGPDRDAFDEVVAFAQTAWGQVQAAGKSLWIEMQNQFDRVFANVVQVP